MRNLIVYSMRGDVVETRHKVHGIAFQGNNILFQTGDVNLVTPMRSAAKPFMVCPQIDLCMKNGINLTDKQLSLMISSHNGEYLHRSIVQSILDLSNSTVNDLVCGTHMPYFNWLYEEFFEEKNFNKRQLFHNCSGKHAGMLLLSTLIDADKNDYWKITHPVQQTIAESVKNILDCPKMMIAIDGCGVPTYCVSLWDMAKAYQKLYKDNRLSPVLKSAMNEPYMIAGSNRLETDLMLNFQLFAKSGSEGIFCVAIPNEDIGVVVKVEDGNDDASESAIVEVLTELELIPKEKKALFEKYRCLEIYTSTGILSGHLVPQWI